MNYQIDLSVSRNNLINQINDLKGFVWSPPPVLTPSEWAEKNVKIPAGNAIPGYIRFDNAPYQVEPLNMANDPDTKSITLQFAAQTGKTQLMLCMKAFFIAEAPCSQIMMQPTQGDLKTWLETKFNPMVEHNERLNELIAKPRSRQGVNNQNMKSYPGGWLMFAWSGSPNTMRQRSAPKVYMDEVDGYERTSEGDPISLLSQRAATFGDQRLLVITSTPTIKSISRVEKHFLAGDRRYYWIPCPKCKKKQTLKWGQITWDKDKKGNHLPETAKYLCEHCNKPITDGQKIAALRAGEWRAEGKFNGNLSYHLNELYSRFRTWTDIANSFLDKKAAGDLQTFVNVSLAETWEEEGDQVNPDGLETRAEKYPAEIPAKGLVLTAAVDVQDDRLEIGIEAWGVGEENYKIATHIIYGDLTNLALDGSPWLELDVFLSTTFTHESGTELGVAITVIDSGGHYTQQVYKYVLPRQRHRIYALKGKSTTGDPVTTGRPSKLKSGVLLYNIGVDTAKSVIFKRLGIKKDGAGRVHFPIAPGFDTEYYAQLTAEKRVTRYIKGRAKYEWVKLRPRNEALDLSVYNYAAMLILNPNFEKLAKLFGDVEKDPLPGQKKTGVKKTPAKKRAAKRRTKKTGFVNWK